MPAPAVQPVKVVELLPELRGIKHHEGDGSVPVHAAVAPVFSQDTPPVAYSRTVGAAIRPMRPRILASQSDSTRVLSKPNTGGVPGGFPTETPVGPNVPGIPARLRLLSAQPKSPSIPNSQEVTCQL